MLVHKLVGYRVPRHQTVKVQVTNLHGAGLICEKGLEIRLQKQRDTWCPHNDTYETSPTSSCTAAGRDEEQADADRRMEVIPETRLPNKPEFGATVSFTTSARLLYCLLPPCAPSSEGAISRKKGWGLK